MLNKIYNIILWVLRIILWGSVAVAIVYLCYLLSDMLVVLAVSFLLALIFDPFVTLIERKGINRLLSSLIIFAVFFFIIYLIFSFLVPSFIQQMRQLIEKVKVYLTFTQIRKIGTEVQKTIPLIKSNDLQERITRYISVQVENSFYYFSTLFSTLLSTIAILVIVPFITFFLVKDNKKIVRGMLNIVPNKYFEMSYYVIKKVAYQLSRYVRAWIFDASFVGCTMGIGLYFIGIDNALSLGVIAGFGHLVPYFGPVIGGIPAILISLIQYGDFSRVPYIIFLVLATYAFDNGIVQPFVFSKSLDIHPVIIILLIIAGGQLFGIIGMLLAIPTATVIKTFTKEIYFAFSNYKIAKL
ncbi:MAG: AI-2E family transporter [Ignavibacteriaceae bacterium]|nr:AI-2E family transporter [Ignavibacteriaceae bacterium]